jgi:hypothetical protein
VTQPSLLDALVRSDRPRKRVRQTSRQVYAVGRRQFAGRKATVLRWLAHYWNERQSSPTSGELLRFKLDRPVNDDHVLMQGRDLTWLLLYVRRALSDLKASGVVECVPAGARVCAVTGETCETWRVREAGSRESC